MKFAHIADPTLNQKSYITSVVSGSVPLLKTGDTRPRVSTTNAELYGQVLASV
jgi:hypothetical protein